MAIAELTEQTNQFVAGEVAGERAGRVRVGVHDASRLEWSLSVPLPTDKPLDYTLQVEIQIPQNTFVRHTPWDQMQAFTRLDGPAIAHASTDAVSIDQLRRGALATAHQLARASDGFARHCRLAGSLFATAPHSELEEALTIWIEAMVRIAQESRENLTHDLEGEGAELARERDLVDEYISIRFLDALAGAERGLAGLASSKSPHASRVAPVIAAVETRLGDVLARELEYREERAYGNADPTSPEALESYLDRSSRLKKHFQEVLFLDQETFHIAERAYHWIAGFFALVASTWAFAWQIALLNRATGAGAAETAGIITLALMAGLVYATKDRIKEIGRNWMTRRVHRVWGAERITRYRAPSRRLPGRDAIVTARESFNQGVANLPDPLNPESGATMPVTVLSYEHRGTVVPNQQLLASGVRRVKHVFRYDLSPMFGRLDDAMKPVPVLDEAKRVRFIDAPRCYRVPIKVRVECGKERYEELATLVLHKRGLERLDREKESNPSLAEIGIEPG
ncbi:MAG: hypothetical protein JST00_11590 [Deltaproteobacteria bacterium]|nr:hypothetical protein [Deltaproteobacteria bacterium]